MVGWGFEKLLSNIAALSRTEGVCKEWWVGVLVPGVWLDAPRVGVGRVLD